MARQVVWTHADLLEAADGGGGGVEQWLEGAGEAVDQLLRVTLGGRWVAVDNRASYSDAKSCES